MQAVSVNFNRKNKTKSAFLNIENVKIPKPKKNEILFETLGCGICSTDIEYLLNNKILKSDNKYFNGSPGKKYLGHEIIGKAIKVGKNLNKNIIGKNFVIADINICKSFDLNPVCKNCKKKQGIHCLNKDKRKFTGNSYGGFSEYFIRSYYQSIEINKKVNSEIAIFSEPLSCAINLSNQCKVNNKILIIGLGTISTLFLRVLYLKKHLKKNIFIVVKNNQQKKQAISMGFKNILNENLLEKKQMKFDKIFYFNGKINFKKIIFNCTKPLTEIIIFGHINKIEVNPKILIKKQLSIKGIHGYASVKNKNQYVSDFEVAVRYIENEKIYIKDLIYSKNNLKNVEETISKICSGFKKINNKTIFRSILLK